MCNSVDKAVCVIFLVLEDEKQHPIHIYAQKGDSLWRAIYRCSTGLNNPYQLIHWLLETQNYIDLYSYIISGVQLHTSVTHHESSSGSILSPSPQYPFPYGKHHSFSIKSYSHYVLLGYFLLFIFTNEIPSSNYLSIYDLFYWVLSLLFSCILSQWPLSHLFHSLIAFHQMKTHSIPWSSYLWMGM